MLRVSPSGTGWVIRTGPAELTNRGRGSARFNRLGRLVGAAFDRHAEPGQGFGVTAGEQFIGGPRCADTGPARRSFLSQCHVGPGPGPGPVPVPVVSVRSIVTRACANGRPRAVSPRPGVTTRVHQRPHAGVAGRDRPRPTRGHRRKPRRAEHGPLAHLPPGSFAVNSAWLVLAAVAVAVASSWPTPSAPWLAVGAD